MDLNANKDDTINPLLTKKLSLDPQLFEETYKNYKAQYLEKWRKIYFQPITQGSLRASIFCLLCVTLGTSLLSIPYTMKMTGVILCIIIFFTSAAISHWMLVLISETTLKEGSCDYTVLVEKYYNTNIVKLTLVMCLFNNFGSIVAWNVFITSLVSNILEYFELSDLFINLQFTKFLISLAIVIFIELPICMNNSIGKLHILSIAGCIFILYVILVSICEFPYYLRENFSPDRIVYFDFNFDIVQIFFIFFFAFGNHSTIMNAINELDPKTDRRVRKLVNYTTYLEILIYIITMLVGYFSTYEMTNDIFINRDYQSVFMVIGKNLYILAMICNICLYFYMVRPYLQYAFKFGDDKEMFYKRLYITTFVLVTLFLISFCFSKVSLLISLLGATSQVYLIFVIPIFLYVKAFELSYLKKVLYYTFSIFMILVGVGYFIITIFKKLFNLI